MSSAIEIDRNPLPVSCFRHFGGPNTDTTRKLFGAGTTESEHLMPEANDVLQFRDRKFTVLRVLSRKNGKRLQVSCNGTTYVLMILPDTQESWQHLTAFLRLKAPVAGYPQIIDTERSRREIRILTTWIEGYSLEWYLNRGRKSPHFWPSLEKSIKLLKGLAHAIFFPHHHGNIVHADLKPANLILDQRPERLVMVDFGAALVAEKATSSLEGDGSTPAYTAPELWTKASPDFRADLFSLSVIAFEMLTGKLPFEGLGGKIGHPDFRPSGQIVSEKPSEQLFHKTKLPRSFLKQLDEVVSEGLLLDRENRYPKLSSFRESWSLLARSVEEAQKPGFYQRARKWLGF
jgi:serine/threonine protein kinase